MYCLDERTGMQALEYWATETGAVPGRPGRCEFHYTRHGTLTLFDCLEVHTGQVYGRCFKQHRGEDLLQFLYWLLPQLPRRQTLRFVRDNLATHKRRDVQDFIARFGGRVQLHFTSTHAARCTRGTQTYDDAGWSGKGETAACPSPTSPPPPD